MSGLSPFARHRQAAIAAAVSGGDADTPRNASGYELMLVKLAEDRRRDISRKTKDGLEAARRRGKVGGRPKVLDDDKRAVIAARRAKGESVREIAAAVGVSASTVWNALSEEKAVS